MHYNLIASVLVLLASIEPAMTGGGEDGVQQVVDWVRSNALRLATSDPRAVIDDLRPFAAMVGDARIVSLGESTHGSREHFQLKHRLLQFLVEEKGFTLFGIESGFPACQAINKYVLRGEGEDVLAKQTFDIWDTHEVLELVRWMRLYNADPRHVRKLKFYGFDMQEGIRALDGAIHYLEVADRKSAATIAKRLDPLVRSPIFSNFRKMAAEERIELDEGVLALIDLFDANKPTGADQARLDAWAITRRHAVVLKQCAEALEASQAEALPAELGSAFDAYHTSAGRAKALQDYLDRCRPQIGANVRPLLDSLRRPYAVIEADYRQLSDERRDQLDALAAEIAGTLFDVKADPANPAGTEALARVKAHSEVVGNLLKMLRIQSHRPLHTKNVRDRCMAENVAWILKHEGPSSKIVLWSHNFHACKEPAPPGTGTMGAELDRRFGRQQVVIGFAFGRGSFRATSESISIYEEGHPKRTPFTENPAGPAAETSIDGVFRRAGIPIFALDLRGGPRKGAVADWLNNRHRLRDVGGLYVPESDENHYYPVVPARAFDVMIFTEETTASRPNAAVRERMKMPAVLPHERDFLPGTWRVASVEISTTETDLDKDARRRFLETKQEVGRVVASLRAGELTIMLTLRADGRYTHELRSSRPAEPPYSEVGTWDLDSSSGVIAGKPKSKPASTIDGFRIRRLTRDDLVLRKDFVGEREGSFEVLRLERVR